MRSQLEYGIEIWSHNTWRDGLEGVQKCALEKMVNIGECHGDNLLKELGIYKISAIKDKRKLCFSYKLETMDKNRIPSKVYNAWVDQTADKSFKTQFDKLRTKYIMTRKPTDILHNAKETAEVRRKLKAQFPQLKAREQIPEEASKKEWQSYVKTSLWQRYPHNKPKDYLTQNGHSKFLKLRLAAEAVTEIENCHLCESIF